MSAGMVSQDGVMVTNKDRFKRYNISSYIRSDVYSWITPELDIKYTNMSSSMPNSSAAYGIWGAAVAFPSYFPLGEVETSDGALLPVNSPRNQIMLGAPKLNDRDNVRIFGKVTITPFKDLKIIGEYTFNRRIRKVRPISTSLTMPTATVTSVRRHPHLTQAMRLAAKRLTIPHLTFTARMPRPSVSMI